MSASFDKATRRGPNWWLIGGGCLALFVCACIAAIIAVMTVSDNTIAQLRQLLGISGGESVAIEYVPSSAPMFAVVNPNFSQLQSFSKLKAIFDNNPAYAKRLNDLARQSAPGSSDFDFDRDVRPWIGTEIGVAVLAMPKSGSAGEPTLVIIANTRDRAKSDEALARLRKNAEAKGTTFTEETYKGTKIVVGKSGDSAYATFQDQVLLGSSADAIKKVIDTKQSDSGNLRNSARYKAAMSQLPKDRAASMFIDLQTLAQESLSTRQPGTEVLDALQGIGISLGFSDDGIRIDYATAYDSSKAPDSFKKLLASYKASPNAVLSLLPASSILSITGQDLKSNWAYYRDLFSRDPQGQFERNLAQLKTQTGIDVDEDLFSWMTGEFAIDVVPAQPIKAVGANVPGAGLLLMVEAKDQSLARSKMDKIAQALAKQGLQFAKKTVNGADMQIVKGLETQGISLGYGFLDNYLVIGSAEDVLGAAVNAKKAPLDKDAEFQKALKPLLQSKIGVAYLSIPKLVEVIKPTLTRAQLADFQRDVEPLLKPFKGLSSAAGVPKDDVQPGVIFLYVAE